jgi:hypothetical protein
VIGESYRQIDANLDFGDIFSAAFVHDAHLRADAARLGSRTLPEKAGGGLAYSPSLKPGNNDFILAHGMPCRAVLLSEGCAIDDALGVDRPNSRPQGRLLFAALVPTTDAAVAELLERPSFDRFAVPRDVAHDPAVIELRKLFMIDVRDVLASQQSREARLSDEMAARLEVTWVAFTARRGPQAALARATRLVRLLVGDALATSLAAAATVRLLGQVIADTWTIEGHALLTAIEALEDGAGDTDVATALLREQLRGLSQSAAAAAAALDRMVV